MAFRKIVKIDEEKCNGCGLCIPKCHEGAIEIIDGKAKLIEDKLCDGVGDCLGHCPQGAIEVLEREADEYDDEAVKAKMAKKEAEKNKVEVKSMACGCPGTMAKKIERAKVGKEGSPLKMVEKTEDNSISELNQWPVQLKLVNVKAGYFEGADLLIAADCTAYAYAKFHQDFIKGRITLIGCPKLDDVAYYTEKLTEIFKNNINSITVVRMSVPCCAGIVSSVKSAILKSENIVPYNEVIIDTNGERIK